MTTVEVLKKARALVECCQTTHVLARDKDGFSVDPTDATAVKWCAMGACERAARDAGMSHVVLNALLRKASQQLGYRGFVAEVNDNVGLAETLKLFDRAIKIEEEADNAAAAPASAVL